MTTPELRKNRIREFVLIGLVAAVLAMISVKWVGDVTIFSGSEIAKRDSMHQAILANDPPGTGSWRDAGANGVNVRIFTVWVVDQAHKIVGLRLGLLYQLLDIAATTVGLVLLFYVLLKWFPPGTALAGMIMAGAFLPLTMFLHYFHPWDKPTFALWAAMLLAICHKRTVIFLLLYVLSVVVKYDSLLAAGLVFFLFINRDNVGPTILRSAAVAALGVATYLALVALFPEGQESRAVVGQVGRNLSVLGEMGIFHPPLLTHGLLAVLGVAGWKAGDEMTRRLWLFGLCLLVPHALFTNFVEVRAQVGSIVCMLPLALYSFRGIDSRRAGS